MGLLVLFRYDPLDIALGTDASSCHRSLLSSLILSLICIDKDIGAIRAIYTVNLT